MPVEFQECKWDTDNAKVIGNEPQYLYQAEFLNDNSQKVTYMFTVDETVTHKSQFSAKAGISFKVVLAEKGILITA